MGMINQFSSWGIKRYKRPSLGGETILFFVDFKQKSQGNKQKKLLPWLI
jgi:hypothetical protein